MVYVSDFATAGEQLLQWPTNLETDGDKMSAPHFSTGAGGVDINGLLPFCLKLSKEASVVASLVLGENPAIGSDGGIRMPILDGRDEEKLAEATISRAIILEQFELFKEFARPLGVPFNPKSAKTCEVLPEPHLEWLRQCIDRRNELAHYDPCEAPSIREGIDYFVCLRTIAGEVMGEPEKMLNNLSYERG